ncbi:S8 family serine peptidase [Candidatus Woesearchaeota archaeon]|nr:S8 family serine peptidase [Candidatus Woesearchaeota archaeon]
MKRVFLVFLLVLLLAVSAAPKTDEKQTVIIYFNDAPQLISAQHVSAATASTAQQLAYAGAVDIKRSFLTMNGMVAEVDSKTLKLLKSNPNIELYEDALVRTFLSDTKDIVNASRAWALAHNETNLTGNTETVCVIDSGVNETHDDLSVIDEYCFCNLANLDASKCCPGGNAEEADGSDDYGHGTHVAGIVASSNLTFRGVAPDAHIISVKVTNSSGTGTRADIVSAIDWCVNISSAHNVSVITMSLGEGLYSGYCDSESGVSSYARPINNATELNITVVAATANSAETTKISAPACIQNVTAVGSSTKADAVSSFSNRNSITDLFAPGSSIRSLRWSPDTCLAGCSCNDANTMTCSGTSMSAPHAAGAAALLHQFMKVSKNITANSTLIIDHLNRTGVDIDDSGGSGFTFKRISIYDAIIELDNDLPNITFVAPTPDNGSTTADNSSIFINITSSEVLAVASLEWSNGSTANYSMDGSGQHWSVNFSTPVFGNVTYRIFANDTAGNIAVTDVRSLNIEVLGPNASVVIPAAGTNISGSLLINASVNSSNTVADVNLTVFSSTGNASGFIQMSRNSGSSAQGYYNATLDTSAFVDGSYNLSVNATDAGGNITISSNVSVVFDNTPPNASIDIPLNGSAVTDLFLINGSANDTTAGILNVSFRIINSIADSGWLYADLSSGSTAEGYWNASFNASTLPIGTYNITLNATDFAYNQNLSNASFIEINGTFEGVNSCASLTVSNATYRLLQNVSAAATCLTVAAHNITLDCDAYQVEYGSSASGFGIDVSAVNDTKIQNCIVAKSGFSGSDNYGIYVAKDANGTIVSNNTIATNGSSRNFGIFLNSSHYSNVTGNNITVRGSADSNFAIYLKDSLYANLSSNLIFTYANLSSAIQIQNSNSSAIAGNTITVTGNDSYAVSIVNIDSVPSNNTIYNNIFNTTAAAVNITSPLQANNFSIALTAAANIVGKSKIGGNYYDNSTVGGQAAYSLSCADSDEDSICDSALNHAGNSTDFYPLTLTTPSSGGGSPTTAASSGGGGGGGGGGSQTAADSSFSQAR